MALGTPTFKGQSARSWNKTQLTVNCSTTAGDLILIGAQINGSSRLPTLSGHGASFVQIGSTENGPLDSYSLRGGFSTGASSSNIVGDYTDNDSSFGIQVVTISGIDNDGPVADAIKQIAHGNGNGTVPTVTFSSTPTNPTIHFWGENENGVDVLDDNTSLGAQNYSYNQKRQACGYAASGDQTPAAGASTQWVGIAVEVQGPPVASSGGASRRTSRSNGTLKQRAGG